ncbi:15393_t:CDS:2 [Cetraspora pellucida]|uniref:15393_t:CDS:1 n=1 Tax=Cetraspora pellucida TaxID=1433469 RepID=A0ACA9MBY7_9GLOM|nr:15393_t:CDS:2 [Cetraspora pellucida]
MSDVYPEYIKEFSIEIADFNPIRPTAYIPFVLGALHPIKVYLERNLHHLYEGFVKEINIDNIPILHNQNECLDFCYISERREEEYKPVNLLVITERIEVTTVVSHNLYRGTDALEKFVKRIEEELLNIQTDLSVPAEMIMASGDLRAYNKQTFEMQSFEEYHDLYLKTDVVLLADVFMNYTIICLKDDGLDPSHYVSAPGMFNDSLYKSSRAELKLITDINEYLIVEKGIHEEMTMASH